MRTAALPTLDMPLVDELARAMANQMKFEIDMHGRLKDRERHEAIRLAVQLLDAPAPLPTARRPAMVRR